MLLRFRQSIGVGLQRQHRYCHRSETGAPVKVEVRQGVVIGRRGGLANGGACNIFQGIPYAVPPLGELRFKSPVPLDRFNVAELDCTKERDICFQRDPFTQELIGSENCLFLNIYAPQAHDSNKQLPVMVWIHGGGFFFGSGNSSLYYPKRLMEEQVIVVTLNYRLGPFGFLCFPEEGIWGNAGLKDQRLALQWIQDNIERFNGDPNNVTLFGESAGAAAVHLHMYSRHAHKLFHKAIMQSGTANMEWVFQANPELKTRRLVELLGCQSSNTNDMRAFLQSKDVTSNSLISKVLPVLTSDERRRGLPLPFKPVVEVESPDSFIDTFILDSLQRPNSMNIPTIMGYNSAEGIAMVVNAVRKLKEIDKDLERFVPRNIPLAPNDSEIKEIAQKMRNFYLHGKHLAPDLLDQLKDLLSDYHFTVDMQQAANLQVLHQPNAPLYFYRFNYIGERNMYKRIFQMDHLEGACHGDELFYLFDMIDGDALNAVDELLARRICKLWANFARYANPTPSQEPRSEVLDCHWEPVRKLKSSNEAFVLDYLDIDKNCAMRVDPEKERIEFWREVYATYKATDYSVLSAKL